jgi:hypothetical protein
MRLFRPSGGLLYHLRALRSRARWRGFANDLERWLFAWRKPGGKLILIGPSAGYTLSTEWLRGFKEIHAYDIDPLAAWFFSLRHPGVDAEFHQQDLFWRANSRRPRSKPACANTPARVSCFAMCSANCLWKNAFPTETLDVTCNSCALRSGAYRGRAITIFSRWNR